MRWAMSPGDMSASSDATSEGVPERNASVTRVTAMLACALISTIVYPSQSRVKRNTA